MLERKWGAAIFQLNITEKVHLNKDLKRGGYKSPGSLRAAQLLVRHECSAY
jgi:hypothetical protein